MADKPRITLQHAWTDCGWSYEWWKCEQSGKVGFGSTPAAAFNDMNTKLNARNQAIQPPASAQSPQ